MKLTVLIDLDGTLLENSFQRFQKAYLAALSKSMGMEPGEMIPKLLAATDQMIRKNQPAGTLEETFDACFYPAIGIPKADLREKIDGFYANIFPTLQPLTSPHPYAKTLIEELFARGTTLVLATNPLFPYTAIRQRLEWAGFPLEKYPFAMVPGFQTFHFAKPNPAYFAELLGQIGCPSQPSVMLGDDLELDLLPSALLGIPGFWLNSGAAGLPAEAHPLSAAGEMKDFSGWVDRIMDQLPESPTDTPASLLPGLKATPAAIHSLAARRPVFQWAERVTSSEWSLTEIFCHLRDVESEVNLPRIKQICREDNPFLPGIDTDSDFFQARSQLSMELELLGDCCWDRMARHAIFGPTRLFEIAAFMATHDRSHIQQVYENIDVRQEKWPVMKRTV
jgi:FMN phosphatase YigB (HAD superfamily)